MIDPFHYSNPAIYIIMIDSLLHYPIVMAQQGGSNPSFQILIFGLLFAGMWFLIIAPQRKKQKDHDKMIRSLGTGDEIVTNGGIYGIITNVKGDRFVVRVSDNTKIELNKSYVQSKLEKKDKSDS